MTSSIITKNSSTATAVPAVGDLQQGELAVNVTDKKVYTKDSSAAIVRVVGSLGNQEANAVAITGGTVTGITDLAVADGGTGASTATAAINNLLPAQTSAANKYLQSDGTNVSWDAVTLSTADITGTLPVANGGTGVTSSTGTGDVVLSNSPTLVTPALGTPASGVATNLTGLPISTGVSGLGTGVATFLGTPSSANLISAVTDETGTGSLVFATSPTLVTPALGTPSALVGTNITGTASGLTAGNVTTNANLTGAVTSVGNATSLGSFTSSQLATALTDETGSGANVFATSPTLVTPILGTPTSATLTNATGLPLTTGVTGTLPTANGGTNLTSFTSGGVVYASSTSALATGSALTFDGSTLTNNLGFSTGIGGGGSYKLNYSSNVNSRSWRMINDQNVFGDFAIQQSTTQTGTTYRVVYTALNDGTQFWSVGGSEGMRLTSTGLGIGTSAPLFKLQSNGTVARKYVTAGTSGSPAEEAGFIYADDTSTPVAGMWFFNAFSSNSATQLSLKTRTSGGTVTEALRIDASQNVGVGTTSAISKIHVFKSSGNQLQLQSDNTGTVTIDMGGTTTPARGGIRFDDNDGSLNLRTNSTIQVTLSNAGNLGLGVTPPTTTSGKHLFIGTVGDIVDDGASYYVGVRNAVYNSGWKYRTTGYAQYYIQDDVGKHIWYTAASGTAGNAITFTNSMTLDASGNLLVGTTTTNNFGGTVVQTLGSSGIVDVSSASVAQNGTVNLTASSVGNSFTGFLSVTNFLLSNGNIRTQSLYAIMGRGTNFTATQLGTANGTTGGASFTVTCTTTGVITVTNTYAGATQVNMTFTGHKGG